MPFIKLAGAREALPAKGEQYKGLVREYLRSRGARPEVDSAIEGSFEDLVMVDVSGVNLCIECKETRLSITEAKFAVPVCRYLYRYLRAKPDKLFRVAFFARSFSKEAEVKEVFESRKPEAMERFRKCCGDIVAVYRSSHPEIDIVNPNEVTPEKWAEFLGCCEIFSADFNALEYAIRARGLPVGPWETAAVLVGPKNAQKFLEELASPAAVEERLVSNFFPVISLPDTIVCSTRVPADAKSVKRGNGTYFFGNKTNVGPASTFEGLGEIPTSEWLEGEDLINWLVELLNVHLFAELDQRGLNHIDGTTVFFFKAIVSEEVKQVPLRTPRGKKSWTVVKRYREEGTGATIFAHSAVNLRFTRVGQTPLLTIHPTWVFTDDGHRPVAAARRAALHRRWRRFDRNENRVQLVYSWFAWLSQGERLLELKTSVEPIVVDSLPEPPRMLHGVTFHG
jgi:hypothetical protein